MHVHMVESRDIAMRDVCTGRGERTGVSLYPSFVIDWGNARRPLHIIATSPPLLRSISYLAAKKRWSATGWWYLPSCPVKSSTSVLL